jgi:hypothetical protein
MTLLYYISPSEPRIQLSRSLGPDAWRAFPPLASSFRVSRSSRLAAATVSNNGVSTKAHADQRPLLAYEDADGHAAVADYLHLWGNFTTVDSVTRLEAVFAGGDGAAPRARAGAPLVLRAHTSARGTKGFVFGYETLRADEGGVETNLVFSSVKKYSKSSRASRSGTGVLWRETDAVARIPEGYRARVHDALAAHRRR